MYNTIQEAENTCNQVSPFSTSWSYYSIHDFKDAFLVGSDFYQIDNLTVIDGIRLLEQVNIGSVTSFENTLLLILPASANAINHLPVLDTTEFDLVILLKTTDLIQCEVEFNYLSDSNHPMIDKRTILLSDLEQYLKSDFLEGIFTLTEFEGNLVDAQLFDQRLNDVLAEFNEFIEPAKAYFEAGFSKDGAYTHGDIEKEALKDLFTQDEIYQIYYGNWLRDYASCLAGTTVGFTYEDRLKLTVGNYLANTVVKLSREHFDDCFLQWNWAAIIEVFTVKEFVYERENKANRSEDFAHNFTIFKRLYGGELKTNDLGIYRPEEHIDNPKGLLDESILSNAYFPKYKKLKHPILFYSEDPKGHNQRIMLYSGHKPIYTEKHAVKNIKNYIVAEDTKELKIASSLKYVIAELEIAAKKGKNKTGLKHLGAALHTIEDYYAHSNFVEVALIKNGFDVFPWVELEEDILKMEGGIEKASKIIITTGTFGNDDMIASLAPKIANTYFPKTLQEYKMIKAGDRTFGDQLVLLILNDIKQKAKDPKTAALYGYKVKVLMENFYTYLSIRDKWCRKVANNQLYKKADKWLFDMMESMMVYPRIVINSVLQQSSAGKKHQQTKKNGYGSDPTHTQLAKDFAIHPLNPLAGKLAKLAVKNVAERMLEVWKKKKNIKEVTAFVRDKIMVHPTEIDWLDQTITEWATKHETSIAKVKHADPFHGIEDLAKQMTTSADEMTKSIEKMLTKNTKRNAKKT